MDLLSKAKAICIYRNSKVLVKRIQHLIEQRTTFVRGEKLDLFDHYSSCTVLGDARCYSGLFDENEKCWESNRAFLLFEVVLSVSGGAKRKAGGA